MREYIIAIIALIVGVILKPIGEYLLAITIFNIGDIRQRKIGGKWKSNWSFNDPDKSGSHEDIITLHQFGPFIRGLAVSEHYNYKIKARLKADGRIHGTWQKIQKGADWYGSMMLLFSGSGESAKGKWIGKSTSSGVRSGDWEWNRSD